MDTVTPSRSRFGYRALLALALPLAAFLYLIARPTANYQMLLPVQHFFAVTNISLIAAGVALLLARAALQMEQRGVLLIALGFMSMASLFGVHAMTTPGVLETTLSGRPFDYEMFMVADYHGTVIGLSAYLSLFVPALFFGAAYSPLVTRPALRISIPASAIMLVVVACLLGYGAIAIRNPQLLAGVPLSRPPLSYLLAAASVVLLTFSAWRQMQVYARTRLPMQGALVVAFLLLAQAQVIMVIAAFWTLAWWEYHLLMFAAVILALGALFLELDRRRGLERFLPAEVVERVVSGDLLRLAGERRVVTVVFADLRGSTVLADQLPAEDVVRLINEYVGVLARCVFARGGMLDKFLGDGLMAVFGVVPDPSDGALPAAQAALDMRREIHRANAERVARGSAPIGFGVGIHTGEVVLGAVGIPQRSEFTAMGDTVNTTSRLQDLCKEFDVDIVLSAQTAERLAQAGADGLAPRELGAVAVRGKSQRLQVFTLH